MPTLVDAVNAAALDGCGYPRRWPGVARFMGRVSIDGASFSGSSTRLPWRTRNGVSGDAGRHG